MGSTFISERLYRCLVSTILNSTADSRVGCLPKDLLEHIREVFDFHEFLHKDIVEEESQNRPEYELHVQSLEARDINWTAQSKPYCILSISKKGDDTLKASTPPGSPRVKRKITNVPLMQTTADNFLAPPVDQYTSCLLDKTQRTAQWNEEFRFVLGDDRKQHLKIYVLKTELFNNDSLKISNTGSASNLNRSPTSSFVKNMFNAITKTNSTSNCRDTTEELIGVAILPLKQLPVNQWKEQLVTFNKRKTMLEGFYGGSYQSGSVRLKLRLSTKHRSVPNDLPEVDCLVTLHELGNIVRQFHLNNASRQTESYDRCVTYSGELPDCSDAVLEQFITANQFPRLTKNILNLGVLLEWSVNGGPLPLNDRTLSATLDYLRSNLLSSPHPLTGDYSRVLNFSLSTIENDLNNYLYERSSKFLEHYLNNLSNRVTFFPPSGDGGLLTFKKSLNKFCWELCHLEIWYYTEEKPFRTLHQQIKRFVEEDTKQWFAKNFGQISFDSESTIIQEVDALTESLSRLFDSFRFNLNSANTFFKNFEVDYLALTIPIMDSHLSVILEAEAKRFQTYRHKFYNNTESMQAASKASSKLYFSVKSLVELLSSYYDHKNSTLKNYQQWFCECIHLWLHTSKIVSNDYVCKAIKVDKELEKAADDVNFTASAVHVLSICKEICSDFMKLQLMDPDVLSLSVIKLADIVCDNIVGYARYLYRCVVHRMSGTTKVQLMRAANSIAHIGLFMNDKLPEFLGFDNVFDCLKTAKGENSQESLQLKETLKKLIASTKEVTDALACDIVISIVGCFRSEIEKHCKPITVKLEDKSGNFTAYMKQIFIDDKAGSLIIFLEKALHGLRGSLLPELFTCAFHEIWRMTLRTIKNGTHRGQPPLYYEELYNYMKGLEEFFDYYGSSPKDLEEYTTFLKEVENQSRTTLDIILSYYACIADVQLKMDADHPSQFRGILRVKIGYQHLSGEKINVMVKIVEAVQLATRLSNEDRSSPNVTVELCPEIFFPKLEYPGKKIQMNKLSCLAKTDYDVALTVPQAFPLGTVLSFTVSYPDMVSVQDVEGQAFVHLGCIPLLQWNQDLNEVPTIDLHLRSLCDPHCKFFEILKERQCWDKAAKKFVNDQIFLIYYKTVSYPMNPDNFQPNCTTGLHGRLKKIMFKSHEKLTKAFSANSFV